MTKNKNIKKFEEFLVEKESAESKALALEKAKMLLTTKAKQLAIEVNENNETILDLCARFLQAELLEIILDHKSDYKSLIEKHKHRKHTPLHLLAAPLHFLNFEYIKDAEQTACLFSLQLGGLSILAKSHYDRETTPDKIKTCRYNFDNTDNISNLLETLKLLLDFGINPNQKNHLGQTFLHVAEIFRESNIINFVTNIKNQEQYHININILDKYHKKPGDYREQNFKDPVYIKQYFAEYTDNENLVNNLNQEKCWDCTILCFNCISKKSVRPLFHNIYTLIANAGTGHINNNLDIQPADWIMPEFTLQYNSHKDNSEEEKKSYPACDFNVHPY